MLQGYVSSHDEKYLLRSRDLGSELVRYGVPPDEIVEMHERTVRKLTGNLSSKDIMQCALLVSVPLVEVMVAYGLAFRELVKELEVKSRELQHSNELKELFADIMRHDLLNPASQVDGFVSVLLECEDDCTKRSMLSNIHKSNSNLISMIDKAAEFAKLDSVDELDFSVHDLALILREVTDSFASKLEENNMTMSLETESSCPSMVNPVIGQVFSNLISNSIKYSPKGSHMDVNICDEGDKWKIAVKDNGIGIPETDRDFIFTRFSRLNKVKKRGIKGTGLGLAIVHKIVTLHKGEVGVESSSPESGSTFWVRLNKVKTD
ncbi:ATP-binding protein [Methanolobus sp. ZRKC1]|uniref:ATP-binding protein n=1 Tax=Methanolobus sp. ZRKC1 TaxID=3125781 RepID=UPI003252E880